MRKLLLLLALLPALAFAQSYPSPTYNNVTVNGTATIPHAAITGGSITGVSPPIPITSGGTGSATQSAALAALLGLSTVPIANGGTNAATGPAALANLGGLALTGGTLSGSLNLSYASPVLIENDTSGTGTSRIAFESAGAIEWALLNNSNGDTLQVSRYVGGSLVDTPIQVANATGIVSFPDGVTVSGTSVKPNLSGTTGSIGGSALAAGACASGTVSIANSTTAMAVAATPATYPGAGFWWDGYVSAPGTVTVNICAAVAATPASSIFNVRVIQ
jgi:hypothetical protein